MIQIPLFNAAIIGVRAENVFPTKAKLKDLPPAIHRQQALSAA